MIATIAMTANMTIDFFDMLKKIKGALIVRNRLYHAWHIYERPAIFGANKKGPPEGPLILSESILFARFHPEIELVQPHRRARQAALPSQEFPISIEIHQFHRQRGRNDAHPRRERPEMIEKPFPDASAAIRRLDIEMSDDRGTRRAIDHGDQETDYSGLFLDDHDQRIIR